MSYDNTNKGVLFKNTKKKQDNHPDYTGSINVLGKGYKLAAWINESKKGTKYMALSIANDFSTEQDESVPEDDIPF